jgi:hypothetical protein
MFGYKKQKQKNKTKQKLGKQKTLLYVIHPVTTIGRQLSTYIDFENDYWNSINRVCF